MRSNLLGMWGLPRATTDSGDITYPWLPLSHTHLQRCLRVKFKLRDELGPRLEFLGLWVYVIVRWFLGREI